MSDPQLNPLWLDRGLVQITHTRHEAMPSMPAQQQLDPAEALASTQIEHMLQPQGLHALIEAALHPQVRDRALLLPGLFRNALEAARDALRDGAKRQASGSSQAKLLARAQRALEDDLALRDLAQMYRSVLHQG
jgi:hypothetical protein